MARDPYIERRLENWARWKRSLTHESSGLACRDMTKDRVDGEGWDALQAVPTFDPEASETDDGLKKLTNDLQRTVDCIYVHELPFGRASQRLGIGVAGIHARLGIVHRKLSAWLYERGVERRAERDRVEGLQAGLRPIAAASK